jgi:hypothetical protein
MGLVQKMRLAFCCNLQNLALAALGSRNRFGLRHFTVSIYFSCKPFQGKGLKISRGSKTDFLGLVKQ